MKKNILIIISDPKSINYEIIKKCSFFFKKKNKNYYTFIGNKKEFQKNTKINLKKINFINVKKKTIANYMRNCFKKSFMLLKEKKVDAVINLPLDKKYLPLKYPGFTEYISSFFGKSGNETMLLYSNKFSVCPNTTHLLLKDVHNKLSKKIIIKNIKNIDFFYKNILNIKNPIIGVIGFNPHNGKDFKYLTEEDKIIIPAIKFLRKSGIKVLGPLVPDAAFNQIKKNKINCLVGNYHDQVLPTFKYINQYNAINITLGLPFLRVSPDHGTAKDIINKNLADPSSFLYALKFFEKFYKKI